MAFRIRAWTGPCYVEEIAQVCRNAGLAPVLEGTEHVYATEEGSHGDAACWNANTRLRATYGKDFGLTWRVVGTMSRE